MIDKKEMTAPNVSVGADTEQSIQKCSDNIITDYDENIRLTTNLIQSPAQTDCSVRQTAPLSSAKRNEPPMPQRLTSPAETSRISEYTLFAIRKNLYGNLKKAKQKFGQSRLTRCLKRYRLFFLRTVADGTGRLLN